MRSKAIDQFKNIKLSKEEMGKIFLPNKNIFCRSCQKVRLRKKISPAHFSKAHSKKICLCAMENQQQHQPDQMNNDIVPLINPVENENEIANDDFQNVENNEEILNQLDHLDNNDEEQISEIDQREHVDHNMDIEQSSDENEFVTKREFKEELKNLSERIDNRFDEIMNKLNQKADK